jgi:hypothetical protein
MALFLAAMCSVRILTRRRGRVAAPLDRLWLDFRDAYGAVWGLRIAERINSAARGNGWNLSLTWQGFVPTPDAAEPTPEALAAAGEMLETLVRRFVSGEWIALRLRATLD